MISWNTYDWIFYCLDPVLKEPHKFDVMIICRDDSTPIHNCKRLCSEAIYAQRRHDLFKIGKELGVRKIMNMNFDGEPRNLKKLITQLQLYMGLGGVKEVYYYGNVILGKIIKEIARKFNIKRHAYNASSTPINRDNIKKKEIFDMCVGKPE